MATGLCKEIAACNLNVLLRPGGSFYSLWFQSTALNTYNPRIFLPLSDGFLKGSAADVSGCVHTYEHKLSNSTFNTFIFSLGAKQYTHGHGGQICGCTFISCQCRIIISKHAWQVSRLGLLLNGIEIMILVLRCSINVILKTHSWKEPVMCSIIITGKFMDFHGFMLFGVFCIRAVVIKTNCAKNETDFQFKSTDLNDFENIILKHGCNALLKHRTGINWRKQTRPSVFV